MDIMVLTILYFLITNYLFLPAESGLKRNVASQQGDTVGAK